MGVLSSITLLLYIHTILPLLAQLDFDLDDEPLLNETNVPTFPCHLSPAVSGWFRFLQNNAEAWFHAESGFLYFEYYFPQLMWTAIAASNQTNKGANTGCLDCYDIKDPSSIQECLSQCIGGNEFVITGQSDPTQVLLDKWKIWEVDFTDNGNPDDESQFKIERGRGIGTVTDSFRELVTVQGMPYVHGWWYRSWNNSDGDEWAKPTGGGDPFCVTTIASEEGLPDDPNPPGTGPYMAGVFTHAHKEYTEIHCVNTTVVCTPPTEQPTMIPTAIPSVSPTVEPSPGPTRDAPASLNVEVDSDVCAWANMTLIILVDASESIGGTNWEMSKQWIADVFDDANNVTKTQQNIWRDDGWNITLCMRTALILFSSEVEVKWDLNAHGECYNSSDMHEVIWNMERPHNPLDTIHGTHTKDALWETYEMVKEQRRDDERSMVLLLTDGLPQAVEGDSSQDPCFPFGPMGVLARGYARSTNSNPDGQDIALKVVAVGDEMNNLHPFTCFQTVDFIEVGDLVDLSEYNTEVNNEFFNEFCRVLTYGCNIPIYPHQDGSTTAKYNTSITDLVMDGSITGFLYTFRVRDRYQTDDRSVDIWPHEASIQAESFCLDDNMTLSATLWRWENDSVVDPNPIHSENSPNVMHFAHDKDDDTYNWYNFTFPTNPDSALLRGDTYTLEISIDSYGSCNTDDLQFRVQHPEDAQQATQGTVYQTEYFDDVFLKFKDNDDDDEWYPNVLSSVELPDTFSEQWPFVTLCINEFPLPPTLYPSREPTPAPTESPTPAPTPSPTMDPTDAPTPSPTANPTDAPTPAPTRLPSTIPSNTPTEEPTTEPTMDPTNSPTPAPSSAPTDDPSPAPTDSPTASPTHSPHWVSNCTWFEDTDVIFVVDEACGLTSHEMTLQSEFIADMIQRVKIDSMDPRLGYIGCREDPETVIPLDYVLYNSVFPIGPADVKEMSLMIRDRVYFDRGGPPPRDLCIRTAMEEFVVNDGRNKKIVLVSNCRENTFSDVCAMVDNEIANYGEHIDFIIVNVDTMDVRENHCLDRSVDRHFYISNFNNLVAHSPAAEELVEEICETPTPSPTPSPTDSPTDTPTPAPTDVPTGIPTKSPSDVPSPGPTPNPSPIPTPNPLTAVPSPAPTPSPTDSPTDLPTKFPTKSPTTSPTDSPTPAPTNMPSPSPTQSPTDSPSPQPTRMPTKFPTQTPTTAEPSKIPTNPPVVILRETFPPSESPTHQPSVFPTETPTTASPTTSPTRVPTILECPAPPDFMPPWSGPAVQCQEHETEWDISFTNWFYDDDEELTYVRYEVCTAAVNPYQACSNSTEPTCVAGLFIQIPCLCEICLPEITHHMEPEGKATIAYQGWIWMDTVSAGECMEFNVVVNGRAQMNDGMYKIFGMDGRYQVGTIDTPNPCYYYSDDPFDGHFDDDANYTTDDGCEPRGIEFVDDECDFLCALNGSEFSGAFLGKSYDSGKEETTFTYEVSVKDERVNCHLNEDAVAMDSFYVRLGCDCEAQSDAFLQSITESMEPYGTVGNNYWSWTNLEVVPGESMQVNLTLNGQVDHGYGDLTFEGDSPNGYSFCANNDMIYGVPLPCSDRCTYGQWTAWRDWGRCSESCGGGQMYRIRDCVSVCDGETQVDNCMGDSHSYYPCNTHQCGDDDYSYSSSSSSSSDSSSLSSSSSDSSSASSSSTGSLSSSSSSSSTSSSKWKLYSSSSSSSSSDTSTDDDDDDHDTASRTWWSH